jgi:hypothetical protein
LLVGQSRGITLPTSFITPSYFCKPFGLDLPLRQAQEVNGNLIPYCSLLSVVRLLLRCSLFVPVQYGHLMLRLQLTLTSLKTLEVKDAGMFLVLSLPYFALGNFSHPLFLNLAIGAKSLFILVQKYVRLQAVNSE